MPTQLYRNAYATVVTRTSYLAGAIVLAHTLKETGSIYPLVILYTETLPTSSIAALTAEASQSNIVLKKIQSLLPHGYSEERLIAERFGDTWTKLRVFELFDYDVVCHLDSDMMIRRDMDEIFTLHSPDDGWLVANHACVCNLDKDPWAPIEWTVENCAYTPLRHPQALLKPTQPSPTSKPTHHLMNSGMFVFRPSVQLWDRMMHTFNNRPGLADLKFPDQDFLTDFFRNKWTAVGWQYNALKTMRYIHPNIWRDDEIHCLHYIVDKPWAKRNAADGTAGFRGKDGETHSWWWQTHDQWKTSREQQGLEDVVREVSKYVANADNEENEHLRAIGTNVQAYAKRKPLHS